ncbi:MAG: diacylglycerol/lipid kinase family protein [Woeseiaceae bacterium]
MSTTAIPLLYNPVAGRGRAGRLAPSIVQEFESRGLKIDLIASTGVGDLERKVHELAASGATQIVLAGGDGSIHEAANGILASGSNASLGIVPVGTGNDFAKSIATPLEWRQATAQLAIRIRNAEPCRTVDAGKMNSRFFINGAGIGFDAKINNIAKKYQWPIGDLVYLFAVFEGLWDGVVTPNVHIRYGTVEYEGPITLANISNGPWVGGMFRIAPMADVSDGQFDLILAEPMSRARILGLLPKLIRGTHLGHAGLRHVQVRDFSLEADAPLPSHLDGESQPLQTAFNAQILPAALKII